MQWVELYAKYYSYINNHLNFRFIMEIRTHLLDTEKSCLADGQYD